ncbi:MAG: DUF2520 domain-containing protein [Deltaproteobacteria bacterium]|nr:DUF2520 domain-containing protein [Deltaproteobacteria bacterium]
MLDCPERGASGVPAGPGIFVVGAGRVGAGLALLFRSSGLRVIGQWTRSASRAEVVQREQGVEVASGPLPRSLSQAAVVLVAVSDGALQEVAAALARPGVLGPAVEAVLHCAGAIAAHEALAALVGRLPVGTFHPLVAVPPGAGGPAALECAHVTLEGDPEAVEVGGALATSLGLPSAELSAGELPLYHAAAVMASNHAVVLWTAAARLLVRAGRTPEAARSALLALVRSTVENVAAVGVPEALTGPVRRGDHVTVARHLDALAAVAPEWLSLYRAATLGAVAVAEECSRPPSPEELARLRALVQD